MEVARLLLDVCKGVEFLHSHRIIHRNLRSDHIFATLVRCHSSSPCPCSAMPPPGQDQHSAIRSLALGELESSKLDVRSGAKTTIGALVPVPVSSSPPI